MNASTQEQGLQAASGDVAVSHLDVADRAQFIMRTYAHLLGAIAMFIALEVLLFATGLALMIGKLVIGGGPLVWLSVLGGFMIAGWVATNVAHNSSSKSAQYTALGVYVLVEALIFCPLLFIAAVIAPGAIMMAAIVTVLGFAGLTGVVFMTRKDFSFLGSVLRWGAVVAMLMIAAGAIFGFNLGLYFAAGMVALAGGMILHDTSNVLLHYPKDRYVGAALQLFASVALLFWYVLRIAMALMSRD